VNDTSPLVAWMLLVPNGDAIDTLRPAVADTVPLVAVIETTPDAAVLLSTTSPVLLVMLKSLPLPVLLVLPVNSACRPAVTATLVLLDFNVILVPLNAMSPINDVNDCAPVDVALNDPPDMRT
jgi:hypothetical protein